ncbi:bacterioferritin comigratory protein [Candidatus Blochmanniella floridana]|uniref:thioredoxin-dependent peroxiredoxin n=1 Tax=Blochmanniella floridana TaxID=203907 RepID=Q7VRT0_BLOFL|nr:bacterioferritin comigratory protein [Candidatus Blochmannia floridanus]
MTLLKPGDKIPSFNLPDQDGVHTHSSIFLGKKILIYFYPKAMTPGCTAQACTLRDNMNIFKKLKITIIGISSDKPEKLLAFSEKEMLNFSLLSDLNHQISNQFGVWGEKKFMGKTYQGIHRVSFLINTENIIIQVFKNFKPNDHCRMILNYLNKTSIII